MLGNIQIVLPVFVLIAAGYFATKTKAFSSDHADIVMLFAQKFGLPALLFTAVAKLDLPNVFQPELLISFYTGSTFAFIAAALIARYIFKRPPGASVAVGFTGMFSNTVLLGIPIVERAYGADALQPVYAIIAIHAPYGYLLGITTMEIARSGGQPIGKTLLRIFKEISSNSLTIGIMLGFIVNLSGITLPQFIWSPVQMMVSAAIPSALFSLGAILVRYKLADRVGETIVVLVLKLIIHPGITFVLYSQD